MIKCSIVNCGHSVLEEKHTAFQHVSVDSFQSTFFIKYKTSAKHLRELTAVRRNEDGAAVVERESRIYFRFFSTFRNTSSGGKQYLCKDDL